MKTQITSTAPGSVGENGQKKILQELYCDLCGEVYLIWYISDQEYLSNNPNGSSIYEHEQYLRHLASECPKGDNVLKAIHCPECGEVVVTWYESDREYLEKNPNGSAIYEEQLLDEHLKHCNSN